jgi:mannose-6-phosphate isomerase-like protein (cupin superfamily)
MSTVHTTSPDSFQPVGLIGGIGLTEVHVYAQRPGPDGQFGGCPHIHAVVDEAYYVLRGTGHVEFHDAVQGFRTMRLTAGTYAHFPPRVLHRLVSDGDLVILGMMGSAGLAEQGEARIYFGAEVDASPERFDALRSLPQRLGLEGALQRRDVAVEAYQKLLALHAADRGAYMAELRRFTEVHCRAMAQIAPALRARVVDGPMAWAKLTLERLEQLPGDVVLPSPIMVNEPNESAFGMCGVLRPMLHLRQLAK